MEHTFIFAFSSIPYFNDSEVYICKNKESRRQQLKKKRNLRNNKVINNLLDLRKLNLTLEGES